MSRSSEDKQKSREKSKSNRFVPCLLSATVFLSLFGGCGIAYADDSMASNLAKLEDKYFQHDFSKDETPDRIERLEKLVFGESRSGSNEERLKNLMQMVPNLNDAPPAADSSSSAPPAEPKPDRSRKNYTAATPPVEDKSKPIPDEPPASDSSYPAVTAIEKKLLGRDYIGESVGKRLDRLEIKAFGKTTAADDLQERVDRLKTATGIDVAKLKPANSEWADEEEDSSGGVQPFTGIGADDPSSQRNYRKQAQNSLTRPRPSYDPYAGTGTFGAGGSAPDLGGGYPSGTYGSGPPSATAPASGMPAAAPDFSRSASSSAPAPAMGVSQQMALLEREVFNKTYDKETILSRLNRLESTVFPQDKPATDRSLPERMGRLIAAVPISSAAAIPPEAPPAKKHRGGDPNFPDLDFPGPGPLAQQQAQQQAQRGPGGLSKIINGLGNALSGGYTNGYSTPGTLISDPQTGLLYDQYTGTYIDPMTGAVVSRRTVNPMMGGMGGMGLGGMTRMGGGYGYPSYGGFNSGLSPISPMGGMGGMNFGFGGGGVRFGGWP